MRRHSARFLLVWLAFASAIALLISACSAEVVVRPATTPSSGSGTSRTAGILPAGKPIESGDLTLVVEDSFSTSYDDIAISMVLQNTGSRAYLLRYRCSAIGLRDDLGTEFASSGLGSNDYYEIRQLTIEAGESVILKSWNMWEGFERFCPEYVGPVAPEARKLIVVIEELGPFKGLQVGIDL